jgi:phosphinothricin acetyltransferase
MHIRPLLASDWDDISAITREAAGLSAFDEELDSWPGWDSRFLSQRLVAASREGRITGWAALEPVSSRPSWAGVAQVSVYVAAAFRGQGFGTRLLSGLIAYSEDAGLWTLQAHVLAQNTAALRLLKDHDFEEVGLRHRLLRVDGIWQDAILMDRRSALVYPDSEPITQEIPEAS